MINECFQNHRSSVTRGTWVVQRTDPLPGQEDPPGVDQTDLGVQGYLRLLHYRVQDARRAGELLTSAQYIENVIHMLCFSC